MVRLFANAAHSQASFTALSLEYSLGFLFSYLPLWLLTQHHPILFREVPPHLWASLVAQTVKNLPVMQETWV